VKGKLKANVSQTKEFNLNLYNQISQDHKDRSVKISIQICLPVLSTINIAYQKLSMVLSEKCRPSS